MKLERIDLIIVLFIFLGLVMGALILGGLTIIVEKINNNTRIISELNQNLNLNVSEIEKNFSNLQQEID